jgi:hypothetical protein
MAKQSASALLKSVGKAVPAKSEKKSDIPEIEGMGKLADALTKAVLAFKEAEDDKKSAEEALLPKIDAKYREFAKAGKFTKSFNVVGEKTAGVQITYQDKFSAISADHEDELKSLDPKFDEHFEQKRIISCKRTDLEMLQMLIKKLGKDVTDIFDITLKKTDDATIEMLGKKFGDEFGHIFDVGLQVVAKKDLDTKIHEIPEAALGFVKQAKGAVKLIK